MVKSLYQKLSIKTILIIALILRLILWPWTYHGDVNATYWWGKFASEFTWRGYYDWLNFGGHGLPDQPMLNIYYDWIIRQIYLFFYNIFWYLNINISVFPSKFMQWYFIDGNQYLLKLPMILADILIVYLCYKFTKSKLIALILSLYPPIIYNSAVWGSGDSIITLFALICVYLLLNKKYLPAIIFFLFSVLYKSSLLIWVPVFLIILLKNKIDIKNIIFSALFLLALIYFISSPFNPVEINPLIWFYQTMTTKILPGVMDQVTANAMNLWGLIFGLKPKLDDFLILNSISARNFSLLICLIFYLYVLQKLVKNYSLKSLLITLVNISMVTFCFMTRMHERYSFSALIPLLLLCHYDRRFNIYFIILTITHMINIYSGWWTPKLPFIINILKTEYVIRGVSLINVLVTLKLVFTDFGIKDTNSNQTQPPPPKIR